MKRILFLSIIYGYAQIANAQTYGYLGFWHDTRDNLSVPHTQTTAENATETEAQQQWQQFCQNLNRSLPENENGCFGETRLHNQCVAAAFSHKIGLLKPDNVFIALSKTPQSAQTLAQQQCQSANGENAQCEVETVFCSDSNLYENTEKTDI